jgi:hypothetical protein
MDTVYLRQSTQHVKETKMGFARKQSIAFLVVLLVVAAVEIPGASAKDKDPGSHLVPKVMNIDCFVPAAQSQCVANSAAIPAGHVFVIETITAFGERVSTGNLSAFIGLTTSGTAIGFTLSWINQGVGVPGFAGRFIMAGPVAARFYADPGTTISVSAISGSGDFFTLTLSGYLVECDVTEGCALR